MRYLWQHLEQILQQYDGGLPLHHFLKTYFKTFPKLGSRDRRGLSDAVYAWYRAGNAFSYDEHSEEMLHLAAMYLCGIQAKAFEPFVPQDWETPSKNLVERIRHLEQEGFALDTEQVFRHDIPFSKGITGDQWRMSMLQQPKLFLRVRKDKADVNQRLLAAKIPFEWISDTGLSLANGTKVEGLLAPESFVIQDAASQATGPWLQASRKETWWDCCSGAGGKSLMLKDAVPDVRLLVTDVRQTILKNLRDRFGLYHHLEPESFTLDASDAGAVSHLLRTRKFDGIICDVPCSGSGTWARTPESCFFFNPDTLSDYTQRQESILRNVCDYVTENGRIIYITCSVFRAENEDIIEAVAGDGKMKIVSARLINGIAIGADCLFVAELKRA